MSSIRTATLFSLAQRYIAFVIQLLSSIVLARLLSPEETGIFAMASALVALAQMLRDFGIGEYVVQERDLDQDKLRSALGLWLILGWASALLLFLCAQPVANHFQEPGVRTVLQVLAINFVLLPLGTASFAVLSRELAFKQIFWVQTASALVGAASSIALAWQGVGYMSLAWSSLLATLTTVAALGVIRPRQTFMLPRFKGLGAITRFGGTLTLGRCVDQLCRRGPDVLIAQHLGFHAVGINSKAASLLDAFNDFVVSGISRVAGPGFARLKNGDGDSKQAYLRSTETLAIFPLLFFGLLTLLAEPLIRLLFGSNWLDAVPLMRIGAIGGLLSVPYFLSGSMLSAHGRVKELLKIQTLGGGTFLLAVYLGSRHSLLAVAIAGALGTTVRLFFVHAALHRCIATSLPDLLRCIAKSVLLAMLALVAATPALMLDDGSHSGALACLLLAATLSVAVALPGIVLLRHPLRDELTALLGRFKPGRA